MAAYKKNKNRKSKKNKKLFIIVSIISVMVGLAALINYDIISNPFSKTKDSNIQNNINYGPPTEEEQKSGDEKKEIITQTQQTTAKPDTETSPGPITSSNLNLIISDANQYDDAVEVRAFVPNHFENGTCTMTFKLNTTTVVKQVSAISDATSTICTNLVIARSEFSQPGTWILDVKYETPKGSSAEATQEVVLL